MSQILSRGSCWEKSVLDPRGLCWGWGGDRTGSSRTHPLLTLSAVRVTSTPQLITVF